MVKTPGASALAEEFLTAIYGEHAKDVWTCGLPVFPGNWTGARGTAHLARHNPERANFYFCIGELDPAADRRANDNVSRQWLIIADDVGTKANKQVWETMFVLGFPEPTFRIETSPGNETWGWKLAQPVDKATDAQGWADLARIRAWMAHKDLTDPGVGDEARYIRLPMGWNSKSKYVVEGVSPLVKLLDFDASRVVTLDQFGGGLLVRKEWRTVPLPLAAMGADALARSAALVRTADLNNPEPLMVLWQELGGNLTQIRAGVVEANCPNMAEHSMDGREGTGFAFLGDGLMRCSHGHCQHLTTPGFKQMMLDQFNAWLDTKRAKGEELPLNCEDARHFLTLTSLKANGALDDTEEVLEQAERMSAAQTASAERAKLEGRSGKDFEKAAAKLLHMGGQLFQDPQGTTWLSFKGRLLNVTGKDPLLFRLARKIGNSLTGDARSKFIDVLLDQVDPDATKQEVHFRQASSTQSGEGPVIYVNRMECGLGIKITASGWSEHSLADFPVHMAERAGSEALPSADQAAKREDFMRLVEKHLPFERLPSQLAPHDKAVRLWAAFLTLVVSGYWRPGTVPHAMLSAQQGSGKSVFAKRLIDIMDPDRAALTSSLPKSASDLFAVASGRTALTLDNASRISNELSDALCAAATGNTIAGRKLYSNADRFITQNKYSAICTSVMDDVAKMPDLAQRMLRFDLAPIPKNARKSERELDAAWNADRPQIMGALYDVLSGMLEHLDIVETEVTAGLLTPPRLHDAAIAAEAAARAMGWPAGVCMTALQDNEADSATRLLEGNTVAQRIRWVAENAPNGIWSGTYAELETACTNVPFTAVSAWDRNKTSFKGQYDRLWPDMESAWGIKRTLGRNNRGRNVTLECLQPPAPPAPDVTHSKI